MIFTIDPLTARDFDDALSIKTLDQKDMERLNLRFNSIDKR
jgi:exoribonuclease R